jgi:plastocyanin
MQIKSFRMLRAVTVSAMLGAAALSFPIAAGAADTARVVVKEFMFEPMSLKVGAGTKVTWANLDDEPHTVVSDTGVFRSGAMDTGDTYSFTFDKPGTYHFTCSIHPRMVGTIVVE